MTSSETAPSPSPEPEYLYESTTDPESELRLAASMGYPSTWHVVRIVPHPAEAPPSPTLSCTPHRGNSCMDLIYAGPPSQNVDLYYNHNAAFAAALYYQEGVSTGYENKGGQMLPRKAMFSKGDRVEVFYEPDEMWQAAEIVKAKLYDDDIRYTVHYTEEDAKQTNVRENHIRLQVESTPAPKKKKIRKTTTKKTLKKKLDAKKQVKKRKREEPADQDNSSLSVVGSSDKDEQESSHQGSHDEDDTEEALALAESMGLPEGWTARPRPGHRFYIKSSDGKHRFRSKTKAFEFLGYPLDRKKSPVKVHKKAKITPKEPDEASVVSSLSGKEEESNLAETWGLPKGWVVKARSNHRYSITSPNGEKFSGKKKALESARLSQNTHKKKPKKETTEQPQTSRFHHKEEEGDPPWRRDGHALLGKLIKYNTGDEFQIGKVTGWLDSTDMDSAGEPAFLSERTGKPATLFHVNFAEGDVLFVDLEEYELMEVLLPVGKGEVEEEVDEDSLPINAVLKRRLT